MRSVEEMICEIAVKYCMDGTRTSVWSMIFACGNFDFSRSGQNMVLDIDRSSATVILWNVSTGSSRLSGDGVASAILFS